jgi:hypothetical protein
VDVLQRLLGYVTGQIEGEDRGRFKCVANQIRACSSLILLSYISQRYPYVATEVLCSEIWSIVETCLNNTDQLLVPFWETVLDRTPEDMKTRMTMASQFAKINAVFMSKKPAEVTPPLSCAVLLPIRRPAADAQIHPSTARHHRTNTPTHRDALLLGSPCTNNTTRRTACRCWRT